MPGRYIYMFIYVMRWLLERKKRKEKQLQLPSWPPLRQRYAYDKYVR